jgi:metallopeptidase MepB
MNYSKNANQLTFLSIDEVRKLFHEIGHLIHALCTETKYAASQYVDRDFVEAPSLMFEQFFWQEWHIMNVSLHYSHISSHHKELWRASLPEDQRETKDLPPARLQDNVIAALVNTNLNRRNVRDQLKELFFATYDMLIHSPESHEKLERMNLTELFNKTKSEIYSLSGGEVIGDGWEWGHGETVFRNVINGYDAGYYAYIL